jgi:predicted nucleic acid-binding Zn ribbon protein
LSADDSTDDDFVAPVAPEQKAPPPSGIDLARTLLAQARADARAKGARAGERQAVRRGDVSGQRRSGAHPDDRDPQPLGRSVERLVAERGWEAEAAVGGVIGRWDLIVGSEVAAHCTPEGYADAILTVRADSTAWATQVRLLSPVLVARLNAECGDGAVTRVNVLGPGRPSWRKGAFHVRGRGPRDTYG